VVRLVATMKRDIFARERASVETRKQMNTDVMMDTGRKEFTSCLDRRGWGLVAWLHHIRGVYPARHRPSRGSVWSLRRRRFVS